MGKPDPSHREERRLTQEHQDEAEHVLKPSEFWEEMLPELDQTIKKHFPQTAVEFFQPPTQNRLFDQYREALHKLNRNEQTYNRSQALAAAVAIRYVDDFIDEALWPDLANYPPAELAPKFEMFLEEAYLLASRYDRTMPHEIIDLPLLEMHLYLHPDQETFDNNIEKLIQLKSLDLYYIRSIAKNQTYNQQDLDNPSYLRLAVNDYARDFMEESWKTDKDFNLFNHIQKHQLDTFTFEKFILNQLELADPTLYRYAVSENYEGMLDYAQAHLPTEKTFVQRSGIILAELDKLNSRRFSTV